LTLEYGTDKLYRNIENELPLCNAPEERRTNLLVNCC
jgi:hypothetical protein